MARQSSGCEVGLKHMYSSIFFKLQIVFPLACQAWYSFKSLMSNDRVHNSTSLISCIDHSDIISNEFKKGDRTYYPLPSKILPLSVCFFLCLDLQGFALSLTQVDKFVVEFWHFTKVTSSVCGRKSRTFSRLQAWDSLLSRAVKSSLFLISIRCRKPASAFCLIGLN